MMTVVANILDPVHDTLDPTVWDAVQEHTPVLKPQHKQWILDTILDTLKRHGYGDMDKWLEVYLTGSLTTYQYSDESDCDCSLFVNTDVFPEWSRAEMIGIMVSEIDGRSLPGTTHPMQCYVVAKGIRPQDLYKPGLRSGYLIHDDKWVVPPERDRVHNVEVEQMADYQYALQQADKMEHLLRYEPDKAVMFWHQIHSRRMQDQKMGKGDFAQSNIIYKFLANRGLFPQISEVSGEYIAKTKTAWTPAATPLPTNLDDHWLTWNPGTEGKGFVLTNGRVWTWPTEKLRPQHLERAYTVKKLGGKIRPQSAFHINPEGGVYTIGPGRDLTEDTPRIHMADWRLRVLPKAGKEPEGYGHSQDIYEKLRRITKMGAMFPHPDNIELARQQLGIKHPVRIMPTMKDVRGGYAGLSRDPRTGQQAHLIFFNPSQHPGARNWAVWHELAHAYQTENGQQFVPNSYLPDEEYAKLPKEHEAEQIAAQYADLDLWGNPTNEGMHVGQAEAHDTSQPPSEEAWSFC